MTKTTLKLDRLIAAAPNIGFKNRWYDVWNV